MSNNPSGRPRSAEVTERVHQAVWKLLEGGNWNDLTMERLAEEAGVSRPSLYRRYAGLGEVVLGALLAVGSSALPMTYSKSLQHDLQAYFEAVVNSLKTESPVGKALRGVLSQALVDMTFAQEFEAFIRRRREPVCRRIASELPDWSEGQVEAAVDALFGPVLYRLLVRGVRVGEAKISELINRAVLPGGITDTPSIRPLPKERKPS